MVVTEFPFEEELLEENENYILVRRKFSKDLDSNKLVWHRDKEDRYVQAIHDTDWKFQLDNELPQKITKNKLFIPKETYHRLIKGSGNLSVKIFKLWNVIVKLATAEHHE